MIDVNNIREHIVTGLTNYLQCPVRRGNQNAEMPDFPYCIYTITRLADENKGTYGVYSDGSMKKPTVLTISVTVHSDEYIEAVTLANKAHDWFDCVGRTYLSDNDVIVQSVGGVNDRSNLITAEYMYSYGFDCFIYTLNEISAADLSGEGEIETVTIGQKEFVQNLSLDELNKQLENRLDGVENG